MTKSKTKKEKPFWALILALLMSVTVKVIAIALTGWLFCWAFSFVFADMELIPALVLSFSLFVNEGGKNER